MKHPAFLFSTALRAILLLAFMLGFSVPGLATLQSISFSQINFEQDVDSVLNSDWGSATVSFDGSSDFQYFNLLVNGSWQVQDIPVLSLGGSAGTQELTFNFSLGNVVGVDVTSLSYVASLTSTPLGATPVGTSVTAAVSDRAVTVGGLDGALGWIPGATSLIGGIPIDFGVNLKMHNQEVGVDECAPGAFSNSLQWLKEQRNLTGLKDEDITVEKLKTATNWAAPKKDKDGNPISGTGGVSVDAWKLKRDALSDMITTRFFTVDQLDKVIAELKADQDVEIWGHHHAAVVSGLIKHLDGTYTIYVTHDTKQGQAGGCVTEPITYNPTTGLVSGGAPGFFNGNIIRGFVVECPVPAPGAIMLVSVGTVMIGLLRRRGVI